jgi:hydrogenase expression/formation protein HypE
MKTGKLSPDILRRLLAAARCRDARVVVGPAIGEDAAVLAVGDKLLVASTDPITFATDLIGWYAVHVNANDVAVMGARPAWFLATLLLPEGAPPSLAEEIFEQTLSACRELDVCLVGGHTEVTHGLGRPLVIGAMLGEADQVVRSSDARAGDHLILSKGVAVEGTALLAREAVDHLRARGVDGDTIERARGLLLDPGISVVKEALLACRAASVHAMHDPTEGGLATAVHELAEAAGLGAVVRAGDVAVLPETESLCRALGLNPLGLLASGSLLIAVAPEDCDRVVAALNGAGIKAACIGALFSDRQAVVILDEKGSETALPRFDRDELARFLATA